MSWLDRLPAALRRLYRTSGHVHTDMSIPPQSLEQELIASHARRWPVAAPAGGLRGFARAHRWAVSGAAAALGLAAACQVPIDYDRTFGATVWCEAGETDAFEGEGVRDLADRLKQRTLAEQVAVRVHAEHGGPASLRIDLWGADPELAGDEALAGARELPAMAGADCRVEPLVGTVHGTLGGRLGHELFDIELVDGADAELARAQILEQLEARGLRGDAQVEITDHGDGRREVEIRIKAEHEPPAPPR